jgi:hypothetical protein
MEWIAAHAWLAEAPNADPPHVVSRRCGLGGGRFEAGYQFREFKAARQGQPALFQIQKVLLCFWISLIGCFSGTIFRVPVAMADVLIQIVQHNDPALTRLIGRGLNIC